ncbi:MAG TPA: threonylcarbamoyl-AMP synthase, partial [Verrucomicrobiales bacterium]|nr:threonylcarbamoyl-AMP synthase [Verrucomicrobiales bacterium]
QGYAKKIYETLNRCDQANAESILIQPLPLESEWDAVRDRLSRASIN